VEKKDPRGRTPLMLAVTMGHKESVRVLLNHGASVNMENREGWNGKVKKKYSMNFPLSTLNCI
jgi:ankyrin repeat protein